jgi:hypothetical protein
MVGCVTIDELAAFCERGAMDDRANLGGVERLASNFETDLRTEADSQYPTRNRMWGVNILPDPPTKI